MARNPKNPRLIRSCLPVLFAALFAVPMHSQNHAGNAILAEPTPHTISVSQEPSQPPTPDSKPSGTPEEIRQAEIQADTKKLFQLSAELRAEVAKTYKESLSLSVLKKAEEIEKLARSLKTLMDQDAASAKH